MLVHLYEEEGADGICEAARDVRLCHLGFARPLAAAGARPLRKKAAVFRHRSRRSVFRERVEVPARGRRPAGSRPRSVAAVFPVQLHSRSVEPVSGGSQAGARRLAAVSRERRDRARPLLDASRARRAGRRADSRKPTRASNLREPFDEAVRHADDRRCSAGRVPERRNRFVVRGRVHGAADRTSRCKTFSIGFEEPDFNELPLAALVARKYQTDHHEIIVRPDSVDLVSKLVRHFDEPFGDSSAIPTYLVSEFAAQHVKVALTGDGGDELFAGYRELLRHRAPAANGPDAAWPRAKAAVGVADFAALFGVRQKLSADDQPAHCAGALFRARFARISCSKACCAGLDAAGRSRLPHAKLAIACFRTAPMSLRRRSILKPPRNSPATCW